MTAGWRASTQPLGAIVAAMLVAAGAAPAPAQTIVNPDKRPAATKSTKPVLQRTTPASTAAPAQSGYWSVNTDIGSEYGRTITRRNDEVPQAGVPRTRVPLEGGEGTFGLTTAQNVKATRFSDDRPVPGLERGGQQSEGYVGLSVSVPNIHKTLPFLSPNQPTWNRP